MRTNNKIKPLTTLLGVTVLATALACGAPCEGQSTDSMYSFKNWGEVSWDYRFASEDVVFADIDGDGDLDMAVVVKGKDMAILYENLMK